MVIDLIHQHASLKTPTQVLSDFSTSHRLAIFRILQPSQVLLKCSESQQRNVVRILYKIK